MKFMLNRDLKPRALARFNSRKTGPSEASNAQFSFIFDTHSLVKLFRGEAGFENVKCLFDKIADENSEGLISAITLAELVYILGRYVVLDQLKEIISAIKVQLRTINIDDFISEKAGYIKLQYSGGELSLADAIIAATAVLEGAAVVTGDTDFDRIPGLKIIRV